MPFTAYLNQRLEAGGFTTEDALASVLPLLRQVAAAHSAGLVAPMQGIDAIHVENNRLWFEQAHAHKPTCASAKLRELEQPAARAVEVVGQYRVDMQVEHGADGMAHLRDASSLRPK